MDLGGGVGVLGRVAVELDQGLARGDALGVEGDGLLEGGDRAVRVALALQLALALPQPRAAASSRRVRAGGSMSISGSSGQRAREARLEGLLVDAPCRPARTARRARPRRCGSSSSACSSRPAASFGFPRSAMRTAASRRRAARSLGSLTRSMSSADVRAAASPSPRLRCSSSVFSSRRTCSSRGGPSALSASS